MLLAFRLVNDAAAMGEVGVRALGQEQICNAHGALR